jgi:hypothetical protein
MPIQVESKFTGSLTVPMSGDPAARVNVIENEQARTVTFSSTSTISEADARRMVRDFLQAARDAAQN